LQTCSLPISSPLLFSPLRCSPLLSSPLFSPPLPLPLRSSPLLSSSSPFISSPLLSSPLFANSGRLWNRSGPGVAPVLLNLQQSLPQGRTQRQLSLSRTA